MFLEYLDFVICPFIRQQNVLLLITSSTVKQLEMWVGGGGWGVSVPKYYSQECEVSKQETWITGHLIVVLIYDQISKYIMSILCKTPI